ncbi:MAG: serine/threonine protein kinase [Gemmatimonadaceae bacterium]|nr:serine/threonine protein kinase [Gemmatimonadaceae bacterium]
MEATGDGMVAGRYVIEREVGRGGSATVYLARDVQSGAQVALKLLHEEFSGSRAAERFTQEVRLLREFSHPSILTVLDSGEWSGRPFYVMRYVEGESLQERLRRERRLPFEEVVRIGRRLCEALGYAHARKVVHRDVKPANVMLSGEDVYLTDFGIAKALEPQSGQLHSTTGVARGTRAYMSPEQAMADRDLDHRSDIFSLGCVLYEMMAGQNPFHSADESRMLMRRVTDVPDPLSRHRDGVPAGLEAVVMKALVREPADRWRDVGEMGRELGGSLDLGRADHRRGRRRIAAFAAVVTVVLSVAAMFKPTMRDAAASCALASLDAVSKPRIVVVPLTPDLAGAARRSEADLQAPVLAAMRWRDADVHAGPGTAGVLRDTQAAVCAASRANSEMLIAASTSATASAESVSLQVRVVSQGVDVRSARVVSRASVSSAGTWTALIRAALRTAGPPSRYPGTDSAETSFSAWRECWRGWSLLNAGSIDSAMRRFKSSGDLDPSYSCAALGIAIGEQLRAAAPEESRRTAVRALALDWPWSPTERAILRAALDRSESRFGEACDRLRTSALRQPSDHLLLTVLSDCLRDDSTVGRRPNGTLAFQSSRMEALRTLLRASENAPVGFDHVILTRLATVAPTAPTVRWGWTPATPRARYAAYPAWMADSFAYEPKPREHVIASRRDMVPASLGLALGEGKRLRIATAERWVRHAPSNGEAHLEYAAALELVGRLLPGSAGSRSAMQELAMAAEATESKVPPLRLLENRVRLLLKAGRLEELTTTVDSALARLDVADSNQLRVIGPLALMTGRVQMALPIVRATTALDLEIPLSDAAVSELAEYSVRSAIGCCKVRLDSLEAALRRRLRVELDATTRKLWEDRLLWRGLSQAASCRGWSSVLRAVGANDRELQIQQLLARGRREAARRALDELGEERARFGTGDIAVDYVLQDAQVALALGDTVLARRRVGGWLAALPVSGALELRELSQAASIIPLLMLADELGAPLPEPWREFRRPGEALNTLLGRADVKVLDIARSDRPLENLCRLQSPSARGT